MFHTRYDFTKENMRNSFVGLASCIGIIMFVMVPFSLDRLTVTLTSGCVTLLLLTLATTNKLAEDYRYQATQLAEAREKLKQAQGPRRVNFIIVDQWLICKNHDEKNPVRYVLVGVLQVTAEESLIVAEVTDRLMRVEEYVPDVHDTMVKSPWYDKRGINSRTGRYDLKILGEFYDFERV